MTQAKIEWTDRSDWNPIRGCSRVSEGCGSARGGGCYAERIAARFSQPGAPFAGFARMTDAGPRWTGRVELIQSKLDEPLRWRKPSRVFVNSMSDLFHESLSDYEILRVFGVMARASRHTFQVLTKRPARMLKWFGQLTERRNRPVVWPNAWPLPNVHVGVSVEDQATADDRIPLLLQTPAALRFVSAEPLLSSVDLSTWLHERTRDGVSGPGCVGMVLDRRPGENLETRPLSGRGRGESDQTQGKARGEKFRSGEKLSAGDVPRWSGASENFCASDRVDGDERSTDSKRHGNQSPQRQQTGQPAGKPGSGYSQGKHAALHQSARQQTEGEARGGELGIEDHGGAGRGDPCVGGLARDVAAGDRRSLRSDAIGGVLHRSSSILGARPIVADPRLDWLIAAGESGGGSRPCDVAWIRSIVGQCKAAGLPVFVKQLGARPYLSAFGCECFPDDADITTHRADCFLHFRDRKGADPDEWPEDLRVRELPRSATA